MSDDRQSYTVKIPADVSAPDKILFGATARQAAILGTAATAMWGIWLLVQGVVPPLMFGVPAALILMLLGLAVSCCRDGVTLDRLLTASLKQALTPRHQALIPETAAEPPDFLRAALHGQRITPPAPLELPVEDISPAGTVELGRHGTAALASASTVNFALRTSAEQELLVSGFARWLNSLTGPVQITSRSAPTDLAAQITALRQAAPDLPHPLLEEAALGHADYLTEIAASRSVLNRTVLVTAREADPVGAPRASRRIHDAASIVTGAEITMTELDTAAARAVVSAALDPDRRPLIGA